MLLADWFEISFARRLRRLHLYIILSGMEDLKPLLSGLRARGMEISDVETLPSGNREGIGLFCLIKFPATLPREETLALVERANGVVFVEEVDD